MASRTAPSSPSGENAPSRRRGLFRRRRKAGSGKQGRIAQMRAIFTMTRRADPSVVWWMLLVFVATVLVALLIGLWWGHPVYTTFLGLPTAFLLAIIVLSRKAERAAYGQIEGQPGAAGAALKSLRRGWVVQEEPVAVDPRTHDSVFRVVGRPGVVLVSDGPAHRVGRLLEAERRKVARVVPGVPVHLVQTGREDGQVPLRKVSRHIMKMKPKITKAEISAVTKRLRALGGVKAPIPQGIDPLRARPDRRMMRGR